MPVIIKGGNLMRNFIVIATVFCSLFVFVATGLAVKVRGEVTKISKEMVDVKDSSGKTHSIHVDSKTTQNTRELKVGAIVTADVNDKGHANMIWVEGVRQPGFNE
jgi:predicted acyltransferase (DUF342 family)